MKKWLLLLSRLTVLHAGGCKKDTTGTGNTTNSPQSEVPDEFAGGWEHGSIDFVLWENYREGYYAGRNAIPSREAMVFRKNGQARFYRYEFGFGMYEELIDCTGTVTFNYDGTFMFYPTSGRKRYYDTRYSPNNKDRALTSKELENPKMQANVHTLIIVHRIHLLFKLRFLVQHPRTGIRNLNRLYKVAPTAVGAHYFKTVNSSFPTERIRRLCRIQSLKNCFYREALFYL